MTNKTPTELIAEARKRISRPLLVEVSSGERWATRALITELADALEKAEGENEKITKDAGRHIDRLERRIRELEATT